jgi:hypothetical protein
MVRRLPAVFVLAIIPFILTPTALNSVSSAAPPSQIQHCMNGGWHTLSDASGQPFKNQGRCISYAIHHPVSLADLASALPFSGSASFSYQANGCSFAYQTFDATYPGSASVGTVTLSTAGCANPFTTMGYSGSFTITTSVGTLTGTASGPVTLVIPDVDFQINLLVATATGAFASTTGCLQFAVLYPAPAPPTFSGGTVTVL